MVESLMQGIIHEDGESSLQEIPIPSICSEHILIKVLATVLHPVDEYFFKGFRTFKEQSSYVIGFEGAGEIVQIGDNVPEHYAIGQKVSFFTHLKRTEHSTGAWAQYSLLHFDACVIMDHSLDPQEISGVIFNQLTAMCFYTLVKKGGHQALINTAAASSLGKILLGVCKRENMKIICIVRDEEEHKKLKEEEHFAEHVLNLTHHDFMNNLTVLALELNATIAFDAIGGEFTGKMLKCMPKKGAIFIHGNLSGQHLNMISPFNLITNCKSIHGFELFEEVKTNFESVKENLDYIASSLKMGEVIFKTRIAEAVPLSEFKRVIEDYKVNATKGKTIFLPNSS